jgi:hypothetical protein
MRAALSSALIFASLACVLNAQEPTSPPTGSLELGAAYKIECGVGPARQTCEGQLCLASDEWLVLETVRPGRTERASPVAHIPIANRFYKNVGIGRSTTRQWISRVAAATVQQVERPVESGPEAEQPRQPPELKAGERAIVTWLFAGQLEASVGHVVTIDTHGLLLEQNVREAHVAAVPGWGGLPLVGSLFRRTVVSRRRVEQQIALSQVLPIEVADNFFEREASDRPAP